MASAAQNCFKSFNSNQLFYPVPTVLMVCYVQGVVEGVGGVFSKPISGAKEEGVEGFFKGMGKGMMGLVTRPTAGVIDFASGTFSSVKR